VLLSFGSVKDVELKKASLCENEQNTDVRGQPVITASPLNYHLFRQEICSKYPAYQPPRPIFPIEPHNNSILPPIRDRSTRYDDVITSKNGIPLPVETTSIMSQPVHIATPAPSPPPSPAGPGGKMTKKHNYQTNQNFPLMYPPLDSSSNDIGGKGSTELQDALVGRKWYGSDVPSSILEAAELFAKRMRATRAMKQLWEARVEFMKMENGAVRPTRHNYKNNTDMEEDGPKDTLDKVADFYDESLSNLPSFVFVAVKVLVKHATDLASSYSPQAGVASTMPSAMPSALPSAMQDISCDFQLQYPTTDTLDDDDSTKTIEQIDTIRSQELTEKAMTNSVLLLLKWLKLSHILRYEYLSQLLLDANYIPLALKLWQTQHIGKICHTTIDKPDQK